MSNFLKDPFGALGSGIGWVYDKLVPQGVKDRFAEQLGGKTGLQAMVFVILKALMNWYFLISIAGLILLYRLFMALEKAGIIAAFNNILNNTINWAFAMSDKCFPLIANFKNFMDCINTVN